MRKRITNKQAVELVKKGLAVYKDGGKPEEKVVSHPIQEAINKIELDVVESNAEILMACKLISENMSQKKDMPESFDESKLDSINVKLASILQYLSKPREWSFEVERDMMGDIENVNAKQVIH